MESNKKAKWTRSPRWFWSRARDVESWIRKRQSDEIKSWHDFWFERGPFKFRRVGSWAADVDYLIDAELDPLDEL